MYVRQKSFYEYTYTYVYMKLSDKRICVCDIQRYVHMIFHCVTLHASSIQQQVPK